MGKVMPLQKVIALGTATAGQIEESKLLFGRTFGGGFEWVTEGLAKGRYSQTMVQVEGVDSYLLVYSICDRKILFINAVAELKGGKNDFAALVEAMEILAEAKGCIGVEGLTLRAGMVKQLSENGFKPVGVCMTKIL